VVVLRLLLVSEINFFIPDSKGYICDNVINSLKHLFLPFHILIIFIIKKNYFFLANKNRKRVNLSLLINLNPPSPPRFSFNKKKLKKNIAKRKGCINKINCRL